MEAVQYSFNKENSDYIMINNPNDIGEIIINSSVPEEIKKTLSPLFKEISYWSIVQGVIVDSVAVHKDSDIGMLITSREDYFMEIDEEVTYEQVINAFLVAEHSKDVKMSNKMGQFFRNSESVERIEDSIGTVKDLLTESNEKIINYILENDDFERYFNQVSGRKVKPNIYGVYENGEYIKRALVEDPTVKEKK